MPNRNENSCLARLDVFNDGKMGISDMMVGLEVKTGCIWANKDTFIKITLDTDARIINTSLRQILQVEDKGMKWEISHQNPDDTYALLRQIKDCQASQESTAPGGASPPASAEASGGPGTTGSGHPLVDKPQHTSRLNGMERLMQSNAGAMQQIGQQSSDLLAAIQQHREEVAKTLNQSVHKNAPAASNVPGPGARPTANAGDLPGQSVLLDEEENITVSELMKQWNAQKSNGSKQLQRGERSTKKRRRQQTPQSKVRGLATGETSSTSTGICLSSRNATCRSPKTVHSASKNVTGCALEATHRQKEMSMKERLSQLHKKDVGSKQQENERQREMSIKEQLSQSPPPGTDRISYKAYLEKRKAQRHRKKQRRNAASQRVGSQQDMSTSDRMTNSARMSCNDILKALESTKGGQTLSRMSMSTKNAARESFRSYLNSHGGMLYTHISMKLKIGAYSSLKLFMHQLFKSFLGVIEFFCGDDARQLTLVDAMNLTIFKLGKAFGKTEVTKVLRNCIPQSQEIPARPFPSAVVPKKISNPQDEIIVIESSDEERPSAPTSQPCHPASAASRAVPPNMQGTAISISSDDEDEVFIVQPPLPKKDVPEGEDTSKASADSDIEVVDGSIQMDVPTCNQAAKPTAESTGNGELEVVGVRNECNYPHARFHCPVHDYEKSDKMTICARCYCYICDIAAPSCKEWRFHCLAVDKGQHKPKWLKLRATRKRDLKQWQQLMSTEFPPQYHQWPLPLIKQECLSRKILPSKEINKSKKGALVECLRSDDLNV